MPSPRRSPRGAPPGGSRRPGARGAASGRSNRPPVGARATGDRGRPSTSRAAGHSGTGSTPAVPPATPDRKPPRFTGRMVVLLLVLAVLAVSYASSMRAYLQQRAHIHELKGAIARREANIDALEREKRRWQDPAFVKAQARERFGYLMPGETGFQVLDENGEPLESESTLHDPDEVVRTKPTAWWTAAWDSMELAGHPPKPGEGPAEEIDGTRQ